MTDARKTAYTFSDYVYWNLMLSVPVVAALSAIFSRSTAWGVAYIVCSLVLVGVLLRFFCAHCPHYTRDGKRVHCVFFWGVPKWVRPRTEPPSPLDQAVSIGATVLWGLFPVYWLASRPALFLIYGISLITLGWTLRKTECRRCIHEECPANCAR